jgi:hypothetical protein
MMKCSWLDFVERLFVSFCFVFSLFSPIFVAAVFRYSQDATGVLPLPEEEVEHGTEEVDLSLAKLTNEKLQLNAKDLLVLELVR